MDKKIPIKKLKVGTRGSPLALAQTKSIINNLLKFYPGLEIEIIKIKTEGDIKSKQSLYEIGGKGVFVKEIEKALIEHKIDFAVHSLKDLPTKLPEDLVLRCVTARENPCDVLMSSGNMTIETLPIGARIGTGSLRRIAQLLAYRKDLKIIPLRGNVDTRIKKLKEREVDAIIVALAGIKRLGMNLKDIFIQEIPVEIILPAVGQGALGVETRKEELTDFFAPINCIKTEREIRAERKLLERLGGGCRTPIGCLAQINSNNQLILQACICKPDGSQVLREKIITTAENPEDAGIQLAEILLKKGADKLLRS